MTTEVSHKILLVFDDKMPVFPPSALKIPELWSSSAFFALSLAVAVLFFCLPSPWSVTVDLKERSSCRFQLGLLKISKPTWLNSNPHLNTIQIEELQEIESDPVSSAVMQELANGDVKRDEKSLEPSTKEGVSSISSHKSYGLLVTKELEKALAKCNATVERIARECREENRRFRDIEFDIEMDKERCLHGLEGKGGFKPADVRRVTEIFDDPKFFVNGADSNDIVQGAIGDCWFLSALSTMSTSKGLVEKFCVARDEHIGVYGFIFWRNNAWLEVIIDDMLFSNVPKWECLTYVEQSIYHHDKDKYNDFARKGGKGLYFAKSGDDGETWVPLIEKAYAKLHGNYSSLIGGRASEAIEDLTGGVTIMYRAKDILDIDKFWNEELVKATQDRLFSCSFPGLDTVRNEDPLATVDGLFGAHAYSLLRVREIKGKRFVVIRNPWGKTEWTGPWSDGSKEWTQEWLKTLPELDHVLGDDGEFVMEYGDFLNCWEFLQRTLIFDPTWTMSQLWLRVPPKPDIYPWTFGEVVFRFILAEPSSTVIVLSQLDSRYFEEIGGRVIYSLEFVVCKRGEKEWMGTSSYAAFWSRSVTCELQLEAGEYTVYPRFIRSFTEDKGYYDEGSKKWDNRKLSRIISERTKSQSIAKNFEQKLQEKHIPVLLPAVAEVDADLVNIRGTSTPKLETSNSDPLITTTTTTTTTTTEIVVTETKPRMGRSDPPEVQGGTSCHSDSFASIKQIPLLRPKPDPDDLPKDLEDLELLFTGLRVYTQNDSPVIITGQIEDVEIFSSAT